jgi:hypothetical protein
VIDEMFVFDGVLHFSDFSGEGLREFRTSEQQEEAMREAVDLVGRVSGGKYGYIDMKQYIRNDGHLDLPPELRGSFDAIYHELFESSPTDMAIAGNIPFVPSDKFVDPDRSLKLVHSFVQAHKDRLILGGGTDPTGLVGMSMSGRAMGLNYCLEAIEYQVKELGARSMKFYPFAWKCNDEKVAYPMYEKIRELGLNIVQVHKNLPMHLIDVEMQRPNDLQAAARDFPDLNFIIHHPMTLYFDETLNIASRFPNIYLLLSPLIHFTVVKPRLAVEMIGRLLQEVGSDKLVWGSEGLLVGNPSRYIEAFVNLQMPADLRQGYGLPEITRDDKAKILGLNLARLFGVDVAAKTAEFAEDTP